MVIRAVAPQITTFSLPFARFGIMRFGARGTLGECRFSPPLQVKQGATLAPELEWARVTQDQ